MAVVDGNWFGSVVGVVVVGVVVREAVVVVGGFGVGVGGGWGVGSCG